MRRFVVHVLIFALIQAAILAIAWRSCPDDPDHYMAATLDKHARLRSAESPRLIFVGGSSVGFGIDSREFESLGLAPVNMGLNATLGIPFMLAEVEGQLRRGDVVVIAPETRLYWTSARDDAIWAILQRRPASLRCLAAAEPRAIADMLDQGLHFFARKLRCAAHQVSSDASLPTIYRRSGFDEVGDFVAHRELSPKYEEAIDGVWPEVETLELERSIAALQRFAASCERVGARCFLTWSPVRELQFASGAELFAQLEARLRAEVDLPLLERPEDLAHPEAAFFDRGPHLTGAAARDRSRRLAARLRAALAD
ncbi:MAG: hypothetical protein R6X02_00185 [Enhygromyxa sp.]